MELDSVDGGETVAQVLRRRPGAVTAFVSRGMACPGCALAPFETLVEVAEAYGEEPSGLLADIARAAARPDGR